MNYQTQTTLRNDLIVKNPKTPKQTRFNSVYLLGRYLLNRKHPIGFLPYLIAKFRGLNTITRGEIN